MTETETVQREKVTLAMPHTHGGKQHKAGEEIEVSPSQKIWLGKRGIIDVDPQTEKPTEGE